MKKSILIFLLLSSLLAKSQTIIRLSTSDNSVSETSGLIFINHRLITHNDSGGEPALYEIDTANGQVSRKVIVSNATNVDWEDITADSTYIYIGDIGNNLGNRTDLKIYRVLISDYLNASNDSILADTINFSYSNQSNFTPANMATNFDAEALVSLGDSLYIFTKNWKNSWTNIYSVYNKPGNYSIYKKDSLDVKGLISGGTYNPASKSIILTGYNFLLSPFAVIISGVSNGSFTNATLKKNTLSLPPAYSSQVEAICHIQDEEYFISSEAALGKSASLFHLNMKNDMSISDVSEEEGQLYPNPVSNTLHINKIEIVQSEIYSESGILLLKSDQQEIDVSNLASGSYILITLSAKGKADTHKIMIN